MTISVLISAINHMVVAGICNYISLVPILYSEKAMAPHSSTLAWKIPWMEESGRLQSMRSLGVGHNWTTSLWLFTFIHWRRKWHPLQYSCLEDPRDGGAWWTAVCGIAQSQTRLKRLSSSSSSRLEKEMATRSSVLTWRIPGTGEPGGLPSMGSHRVGYDWSDIAVAAARYKYIKEKKKCS